MTNKYFEIINFQVMFNFIQESILTNRLHTARETTSTIKFILFKIVHMKA